MADRYLKNTYALDSHRLTNEEIVKAFSDFDYFTSHCQQIVDKNRRLVHMRLNRFQRMVFSELTRMVDPKTRLNHRHDVVFLKPRQVGATTGLISWVNYICAYVEGMENLNILHSFPVTDTIAKIYSQKVEPIITGVHPDIMPTIKKEANMSSSIRLTYQDILGVRRNNCYDLVSAGASSIRSGTVHVWLADECLGGDTEILTDKGYKKLKNVTTADRVAQFSEKTGLVTYVHPIRTIKKKPTRRVYSVKLGDKDSVVMTGGHELLLKSVHTGKYHKKELEDVAFTQQWRMPTASMFNGEASGISDYERLLIALQADGTLIEGKQVSRARITLSKPRKIERFHKLISSCAEKGYISWRGTVEIPKRPGRVAWNFQLKERINFKDLTNVFSFDEPPARAKAIVQEMLEWDGYKGTTKKPAMYYSSIVKNNADLFCALGCIAGYSASQSICHDNRSPSYSDVYRCTLVLKQYRQLGEMGKTEIEWDDDVYCVTVPDGNIVIRAGLHHYVVGNCGFYRHPDVLEDAVSGSMPDTGFSLVVYASTFEDKMGEYYRKKIEAARDNPDTWSLIFAPWFMVYPEAPRGIPISEVELNDYDQKVIIPAMKECDLPIELWGDAITWYHQKRPRISNMQKEYPTTLDEVLALGENRLYFSTKSIERQKDNVEIGQPSRLVSDVQTNQISLLDTDASPLKVFRKPAAGHKYTITVDPILSVNEESDLFCASVWDMRNLEQVATYRAREMSQEDYADAIVSLAKVYNRAQICPEQNLSEAFVACVRALGYYNFYYIGKNERAKKIPGIRTTARSKEELLDRLALLLNNNRVIIHDPIWVEELGYFERVVKERADGSTSVKAMARKGKHDDTVTTLWVLAGMLDRQQLTGTRSHGIAFL